ncbi:MAG TPA: biotin/lipoyl-containing protein [Chthonomonadaceae bacterium]|nr:biotin/lipoyl-containing protein [Chthonomonadaceae bacterium]
MDFAELERLLELIRDANIRELTLRQGESRLTLRKTPSRDLSAPPGALVPVAVEMAEEADVLSIEETVFLPEGPSGVPIIAPLVGIFRHVKPMVGLGAQVTEGQVVGVIEAMRLINDVTAPATGTVLDVLVEDGLPVEYGQTLFLLQSDFPE